jgi:hypothetical protein
VRPGARAGLRIFGDGRTRSSSTDVVVAAHGGTARLRIVDDRGATLAARRLPDGKRVRIRVRTPTDAARGAALDLRTTADTQDATVQVLDVRPSR